MKIFSMMALVAYAFAVVTARVEATAATDEYVQKALTSTKTNDEFMVEDPLVWQHTKHFALKHVDSMEEVTTSRGEGSVNKYGHKQPYDEQLHLSFKSFDRDFEFNLKAHHDLYGKDFTWDFHNNVDEPTKEVPIVYAYVGHDQVSGCRAHVTVHSHEKVHATVANCNDAPDMLYTLDHIDHFDHPEFSRAIAHKEAQSLTGRHHVVRMEPFINFQTRSAAARRLAQSVSSSYERWSNCYPNIRTTGLNLAFGLAMDYGYVLALQRGMRGMTTTAHGAQLVHDANVIYASQFHVWLVLKDSTIMTATGGPTWNWYSATSNRCKGNDPTGALAVASDMSGWKMSKKRNKVGTYHLLTYCNVNGASGMSPIGHTCNNLTGIAFTSLTRSGFSRLYKTFVHENGHSLGSNHPFGIPVLGISLPGRFQRLLKLPKEGETGGVMDYHNTNWKGIFQFAQSSKKGICNNIKKDINKGYKSSCFTQKALESSDMW